MECTRFGIKEKNEKKNSKPDDRGSPCRFHIIPYSGKNTTAYTSAQIRAGDMPDIYTTTIYVPGQDDLSDRLIDLSGYDFTNNYLGGKKVVPFATSGGSGMGKTNKELAASCKGAELVEGRRFAASAGADELKKWEEQYI